jgi:hypothetical protein
LAHLPFHIDDAAVVLEDANRRGKPQAGFMLSDFQIAGDTLRFVEG